MAKISAVSSSFTDELWHSIEQIYAAILRHPFIAGLTDGSLAARVLRVLCGPGFGAIQHATAMRAVDFEWNSPRPSGSTRRLKALRKRAASGALSSSSTARIPVPRAWRQYSSTSAYRNE